RDSGKQRNVAWSHNVKVHRIKCGQDQDAREEAVDLEFRVQHTRQRSGHCSATEAGYGSEQRMDPVDQEHRGQGGAESYGSVRSDVGKMKDPKTDEVSQRQKRKDESDRQRSKQ